MKRRILLADDDLAILLTLKAVLEISGFDVETAQSSQEARQKLRAHDYHMVITDMRMESEDAGLEVVAAARRAKCNPAVAMLTAFPDEGSDQADGAHKLLVKPIDTANLLRQLEALLVAHEDQKRQPERVRAALELVAAASKAKRKTVTKPAKSGASASAQRKPVAKVSPVKAAKKSPARKQVPAL